MKRYLLRLLLTLAFLILVSAVTLAQDEPAADRDPLNISFEGPAKPLIAGIYDATDQIDQANIVMGPMSLTAGSPSDTCSEAPPLIIGLLNPADGNKSDISFATEAPNDPKFSCMWGEPSRKRGYRTVWYQMTLPTSGTVDLSTFSSSYDTVLGVYTGECGNLTEVRCNDDNNGFNSFTTLPVTEGQTYYIEMADWQPGIVDGTELEFSALLQPITSKWEPVSFKPATPAISRHATVVQGDNIYVVGGQTGQAGLPVISNQLVRFNTSEQRWYELQNIPGAGYSNTTAALANNKIYLPSGYTGSNLGYDGIHWSYDIAGNSWSRVAGIEKSQLPYGVPFAYAASSVPPTQNRYFLTGGLSSPEDKFAQPDARVNDTTFTYLPNSNTWRKLAPMQAGRYAHTSVWMESGNLGICVAGGIGVQEDQETGVKLAVLHRSAECYNPGGGWAFVGDLQIPRFGAGSAVGPDGKWYVFGGITAGGLGFQPVFQTEVFDPATGTWSLLEPSYNLGNVLSLPARGWPRGEFVGNELFVIGGSIGTMLSNEKAVPLVEKVFIPTTNVFFATIYSNFDDYLAPDDNFGQARPISYGVPQARNFNRQLDFFDFFYFDITENRRVTIDLVVPDGNNFDLHLYGENKLLWSESTAPFNGQNEQIAIDLVPRRYYIKVSRVTPSGQPNKSAVYTISIN